MRKLIQAVIISVLIGSVLPVMTSCEKAVSLKIGILLPLTGPNAVDSEEVLNWARDKVNLVGGINNQPIELVYKDTNGQDVMELARQFINDKTINIVIGPGSSAEVYDIAPLFIKARKILISPFSTAGDIFRAFGKKKFFWRTCQSDVAQVRTILYLLSTRNVKRVALIYEDSAYGKTFSDWAGFFSMELGIELLNLVKFEGGQSDFSGVLSQALEGHPEYLICVAFSQDATNIEKALEKTGSHARLFCTDAAETQFLLDQLGDAAEGLELTTPAADPDCGFETAYEATFGYMPWDFAATTYDAFLLAVCTLARNEYKAGKEKLEESFQNIISGRGMKLGWDKVNEAINMILHGYLPDIEGASGPLDFDKEFGVDPLKTFYSLCRVETRAGIRDFRTIETVSSDKSLGIGILKEGASAYRTQASRAYQALQETGGVTYTPTDRRDLWAVVVSTSAGWKNYRHQADALAIYDMLKTNGVNDDKIILFLVDDIPYDKNNPLKGNVHHVVGGKNLRENASIDYSEKGVTIENLKNVLLGIKTAETPAVLATNEHSNILLFIVNHGIPGSISFEKDDKDYWLKAEKLNEIIDEMNQNKRYRQMFIMVEVCYGESMSLDIKAPGVVFFTGSAKSESSLGANYDGEIRTWLADDFTYQVISAVSREPHLSIADLYVSVYERVAGSHVRLKNYENFGDIRTARLSEFITP